MNVWRWALWAVAVFAGVMAFLLVFDAEAAPTPDAPPKRRPPVSIADLTCERPPARMMIAIRRDGRVIVSFVDDKGCLRWRPGTSMVRPR